MPSTEEAAADLMTTFAKNTGLFGDEPGRRYLWTDAFAVGNFLGLARRPGQEQQRELALRTVERVHHVLGRHRPDDSRTGWISGLDEYEGAKRPTCAGLRIGKPMPERPGYESYDERLEWERDGQYFHYLTKWMHALDLVARSTGQSHYNVWARELAHAAARHFAYGSTPHRRMHWKMSIDLSRPLVASMGQHDPLDGFLTCIQLQHTMFLLPDARQGPHLKDAISDFASMLDPQQLATADPLGLGGLLTDVARLVQLMAEREFAGEVLMDALLRAAQQGLSVYARDAELGAPAWNRLAFRELGLSIGLSAVQFAAHEVGSGRLRFAASAKFLAGANALAPYDSLGAGIRSFWMEPANRQARSWREHEDINDVMLASSLVPDGIVQIPAIG